MSNTNEGFEVGDEFIVVNDMNGEWDSLTHRIGGKSSVVVMVCDDGTVLDSENWWYPFSCIRKVNEKPAPRKINIYDTEIFYNLSNGITTLSVYFTVGDSELGSLLETIAVCSKSDTFSERTGRKIAMQRACDILGVTMREIGEVM